MTIFRAPQKYVRINVDFYSDAEKAKLSKFRGYKKLAVLANEQLKIPIEQFLTYYLFKRRRPGVSGIRTYEELRRRIPKALDDLEDYVQWDGESLSIPMNAAPADKGMVERIGEAVALSVVNEIYGMTAADWGPVPEIHGEKTLDYELGSDGFGVIQMEAKGTSQSNNFEKSGDGSVYSQASDIRCKKEKADSRTHSNHILSKCERYGIITSIQVGQPQVLKTWVLDPPPDFIDRTPKSIQLLNRMKFLVDLVSFVFPRSQITSALATRYVDMVVSPDPMTFTGVPLKSRSDKVLEVPKSFQSKSRTEDESIVGLFFQSYQGKSFFLGFNTELLSIALKQDFELLMSFQSKCFSNEAKVICSVPAGRMGQLDVPYWARESLPAAGTYSQFVMSGELNHSAEGFVFGALEFSEEQ